MVEWFLFMSWEAAEVALGIDHGGIMGIGDITEIPLLF